MERRGEVATCCAHFDKIINGLHHDRSEHDMLVRERDDEAEEEEEREDLGKGRRGNWSCYPAHYELYNIRHLLSLQLISVRVFISQRAIVDSDAYLSQSRVGH